MMTVFASIFSGQELIIVAVLILLLFGGKKIPELMRGVGKGVGELHKGIEEGKAHFTSAAYTDSKAEEPKPVEPARTEDPVPATEKHA